MRLIYLLFVFLQSVSQSVNVEKLWIKWQRDSFLFRSLYHTIRHDTHSGPVALAITLPMLTVLHSRSGFGLQLNRSSTFFFWCQRVTRPNGHTPPQTTASREPLSSRVCLPCVNKLKAAGRMKRPSLCNIINDVRLRQDYYTCRSHSYCFIHSVAGKEKENGWHIQEMLWANANFMLPSVIGWTHRNPDDSRRETGVFSASGRCLVSLSLVPPRPLLAWCQQPFDTGGD